MPIDYARARHFPPGAPALRFTPEDAQRAYDLLGANCGPGAIAATCGSTPEHVARLLGPKLQKLGGTTEIMLRAALDQMDILWEDTAPGWTDFGIARVQWDGPWLRSTDPFEKYRHSHWVGIATRGLPHPMIFDINAISVGGWISLAEWDDVLRPWLLSQCEPLAPGGWELTDTIRVRPPISS